jgi:hypothetical protein
MDPYRTAPHTRSPRDATPAGGIVALVVGAWVVLGTGAPIGKDAALWAFTAALVMAIALVWRRAMTDRRD